MRLELDNLGESGKFAHTYQPGELALEESDLRMTEAAEVSGRVRRKGAEVELLGHLSARVEAPCARCLKPVALPIATDFAERFVPAVSWRLEAQHELCEEDLNLSVFDGQGIALDDLVREEMLLAVPGQVHCGPECKGLCPVCGVDLNLTQCACDNRQGDARWEALKDLRF